jgi:hypothetical protein
VWRHASALDGQTSPAEPYEKMILDRLSNVVRGRDSKQSAIARHISERGGRLVRIRPTPFAAMWFGKTADSIYDVRFRDARGVEREATCKVSDSGVLSWLDAARDPRNPFKNDALITDRNEPLITDRNGRLEIVGCPFCGTVVYRGEKRCSQCRVPFVGT